MSLGSLGFRKEAINQWDVISFGSEIDSEYEYDDNSRAATLCVEVSYL